MHFGRGLIFVMLQMAFLYGMMTQPEASEFIAVLDGEGQLPRRETPATGKVSFKLDHTGKVIHYRLTAAGIENIVAAHLHMGKAGEEGEIVIDLAGPFPPGGGRRDGILADGTFTAGDLPGAAPRGGHDENDDAVLLEELLTLLGNGEAYVDIHTDLGWDQAEMRPGNFPDGEIRGQVRLVNR